LIGLPIISEVEAISMCEISVCECVCVWGGEGGGGNGGRCSDGMVGTIGKV
jgi:hypothetical protein